MDKLTFKQELFAQKCLETGNQSEAYRLAYNTENMAPETVHVKACELAQNGKVAGRIKELEAMRLRRHEVTADRVIVELSKLAMLDIRKAFDEDGNLLPISVLDDDTAAAVAGLEFEEVFEMQGEGKDRRKVHIGRIHKIKLADKKGPLELLGKNLKLFTDKVDVQPLGKDGKPTDPINPDSYIAAAMAAIEKAKSHGNED